MALPKLTKTRWPNIKKDPKGRYWVDLKLNGKRVRQLCDKLEIAKQYLANLVEDDRRLKLFPDEAKARKAQAHTLASLAALFEEEIEGRTAAATLVSYHNSDQHLQEFFKDTPIADITLSETLKFRTARTNQGAAPSSINKNLERLRNLLNMAERERFITRSPLRDQRITLTADNRVRYLLDWEIEAIRSACADDPFLWAVILFATKTGLRAGELWSLTWEKVVPGFLKVNRPKTSTKDHLPIRATVASLLAQQRARGHDFVFATENGNKVDHSNFMSRSFRPMLARAKIENLTFHDLRHDFCSKLVMGGASIQAVMALAGHSSIKTTMKYAHLSPEYLAGALDVLEGDRVFPGPSEEELFSSVDTQVSPTITEPCFI